IISAVVGIL
nr:Chain C, GP2 PEPTIDE [synthetic construct]1QR1_F Chain F, GP2 PEPTIDE [synthetic construct]